MPRYKITAPDGRQFILTGDKPPSQEAIDEAYANLPRIDTTETVQKITPEPEIGYSPPPEKTWRDYSGETILSLLFIVLLVFLYGYPLVKNKEISGWSRLFLVMVIMPGTYFMFYGEYEIALFLAMLYFFVFGVVWTIQGFRKK